MADKINKTNKAATTKQKGKKETTHIQATYLFVIGNSDIKALRV